MIYLDNSATTYPKPKSVAEAAMTAFTACGGNAGRGDYSMALRTTESIYNCRKKTALFFNSPYCENVIFTQNCTAALNTAVKGLARNGSHFVISDLEHNAVLRPLYKLKEMGMCDFSVAEVASDERATVNNFKKCIRKNTVAFICTGASNVFGIIPPYRALSEAAHENNLLFIMDAAQLAGVREIDIQNDGIDILCCAAHKGLYAPAGTGLMVLGENVRLNTLLEGGTGSNSASPRQPEVLPDRFESGTPNVPGILGLSAGFDFVNKKGVENIFRHETRLMRYLQKNIESNGKVIIYTDFFDGIRRAPILSFNIKGLHSEETAQQLSKDGIAVRAGLHCAPLAHKKMKTEDTGAVRISPSAFTDKNDIDFLINSVQKIAK